MLKHKIEVKQESVVQLSQNEFEELEIVKKCWKFIPERTKGYILGAAEANAERELMRKKEDATEEVQASVK